jgi:hypothetical protein
MVVPLSQSALTDAESVATTAPPAYLPFWKRFILRSSHRALVDGIMLLVERFAR